MSVSQKYFITSKVCHDIYHNDINMIVMKLLNVFRVFIYVNDLNFVILLSVSHVFDPDLSKLLHIN